MPSKSSKSSKSKKEKTGTKTKKGKRLNKFRSKRSSKIMRHKKRKTKTHQTKHKGGYKNTTLGYAMVSGMTVPAINNVAGDINFPDTYAPINNNVSCSSSMCSASNSANHPTIPQPNFN